MLNERNAHPVVKVISEDAADAKPFEVESDQSLLIGRRLQIGYAVQYYTAKATVQ